MFWLKFIKDFIAILREGQTPAQVAGGFALGSILGFSPMFTLQGALVWLILLVLDVNLAAAAIAGTVCGLIAFLVDPLFHALGYFLLVKVEALQGLWTTMYNAPIAPLTRFNNTVVMGSFVFAIVAFIPVYIGMKRLVVAYRTHIGAKVEKWKIYKILKQSAIVQWYERVKNFAG